MGGTEARFAGGGALGLSAAGRPVAGGLCRPRTLSGAVVLFLLLPARVTAQPVSVEPPTASQETVGSVSDTPAAESLRLGEARRLFGEATALYSEQRYDDALALFQRVHALSGEPEVLFNVAQCLRLTARCSEARDAFERYLAATPSVAVDSRRWLVELEQQCLSVTASGAPPRSVPGQGGPEVASPGSARPGPGTLASAPPSQPPPGKKALQPGAAAPGPAAPVLADGHANQTGDAGSEPGQVYESLGAGLLGLAALSAIGSGVFVWLAQDSEEEYEQLEASPRAHEVDWSQLGAEARSEGESRELVAATLAVSTVVLGGVGALLLGWGPSPAGPSPSAGSPVRVGLGWTPGFVSFVSQGEF